MFAKCRGWKNLWEKNKIHQENPINDSQFVAAKLLYFYFPCFGYRWRCRVSQLGKHHMDWLKGSFSYLNFNPSLCFWSLLFFFKKLYFIHMVSFLFRWQSHCRSIVFFCISFKEALMLQIFLQYVSFFQVKIIF